MTQPSVAQVLTIRSGVERATLVRRTYGVVFGGVIITCLGAAFAMTQPALFDAARGWTADYVRLRFDARQT